MENSKTVWNAGRAVGERIAFSIGQVRKIKLYLSKTGALHDVCLFTSGIDSMLRCSDLLRLEVGDVLSADGKIRWRQKKTGQNVYPVLTPSSQKTIRDWVGASGKATGHFLFTRDKAIGA